MPGALESFWQSPTYCHCNFSTLFSTPPERTDAWVEHLLAMDWDNPEHRRILELEGLRRWVRPDLEGYASLFDAVREQEISPRW
jgi:ABC-type phosphate/phosphonate transport system substrate-binding protein